MTLTPAPFSTGKHMTPEGSDMPSVEEMLTEAEHDLEALVEDDRGVKPEVLAAFAVVGVLTLVAVVAITRRLR